MADIDHLAEISIRVYKDPQGQMSGQIKAAGTGIAQFRALCMLIDHLCKANGWDLHKIPLVLEDSCKNIRNLVVPVDGQIIKMPVKGG